MQRNAGFALSVDLPTMTNLHYPYGDFFVLNGIDDSVATLAKRYLVWLLLPQCHLHGVVVTTPKGHNGNISGSGILTHLK